MGNNHPNTSGLKPFTSNDGDNPPPGRGRPKGSVNRGTWARKMLEAEIKGKRNPFTGEEQDMTIGEAATAMQAQKALKGELSAYIELMDSAYGKKPEIVISDVDQINDVLDLSEDPDKAQQAYRRLVREEGN